MENTTEMPNKLDDRFPTQHDSAGHAGKRSYSPEGRDLRNRPHIPGGIITDPELLVRIANIAKKYNCPAIKVTSSQRLAIVGLKEEDLDAAWKELGMTPGAAIGLRSQRQILPRHYLLQTGTAGSGGSGNGDRQALPRHDPALQVQNSVSGCPNKCMDALMIDFGIMGTQRVLLFTLETAG